MLTSRPDRLNELSNGFLKIFLCQHVLPNLVLALFQCDDFYCKIILALLERGDCYRKLILALFQCGNLSDKIILALLERGDYYRKIILAPLQGRNIRRKRMKLNGDITLLSKNILLGGGSQADNRRNSQNGAGTSGNNSRCFCAHNPIRSLSSSPEACNPERWA